jgi:cellobiose phosphorylase
MVGCGEGLLGLRPTTAGIEISPAIPQEWNGFTMEKVFRGKKLHITVDNSAHKEGKPTKVILNGVERAAGVILADELREENDITVVM